MRPRNSQRFKLNSKTKISTCMLYQDYQFWTKADETGHFSINNIRTGDYNLYAWVPGFIGDYRNDVLVTITSGLSFRLVINCLFFSCSLVVLR